MSWLPSLLLLAHLIGLAWGLGAATVKLVLLLRCTADRTLVPVHLKVIPLITRQIVAGMILLTLSGVGWLLLGRAFTRTLVIKLILVGAIWVLGPIIDNVAEPRFRKLAPAGEAPASPEFLRAQRHYLALETVATALFYVIAVMWVLL